MTDEQKAIDMAFFDDRPRHCQSCEAAWYRLRDIEARYNKLLELIAAGYNFYPQRTIIIQGGTDRVPSITGDQESV